MLAQENSMNRSVNKDRQRTPQRLGKALLCGWLAVAASGCSSLLDVQVPGAVKGSDLSNPALMRSLTVAALSEVECATGAYIGGSAILSGEYIVSAFWRNWNIWGARLLDINRWTGTCSDALDADNLGYYVALSRARFMTDDAFARIDKFTPAELGTAFNKPATLSQLAGFAGNAYSMLGEGMCEAAIDGGPLLTPKQVFALAEAKYTAAEKLAVEANDNPLRYLALTGRARMRLYLGKKAEAAADAKLIPSGFVYNATYSAVTTRRQNRVNLDNNRSLYTSVAPAYRGLAVDGVADTRVRVTNANKVGHDNLTPMWLETKYATNTSPIPMASWREAQLIIAEAELGQSAVDRINGLRTLAGLPKYAPANLSDNTIMAQVIEERRRELFLEGHRLYDMTRFGIPFATGTNHKGEPYGPITCHPLPEGEKTANPNL
jgi:hypothetical protein